MFTAGAEKPTIICWKWADPGHWQHHTRTSYTSEHVNVFCRMVRRHLSFDPKIVCITDDPSGITECDTFDIWPDYASAVHPLGTSQLTCFRRLKIFDEATARQFGGRIVSMDLDCVVLGDFTELLQHPAPFVGWRTTNGLRPRVYNGSFFMFTPGEQFQEIWDDFHIENHRKAIAAGFRHGSDQSWMAYKLGQDQAFYEAKDGILSYRKDKLYVVDEPPAHAKIIQFHGPAKPWSDEIKNRHRWVRENWL